MPSGCLCLQAVLLGTICSLTGNHQCSKTQTDCLWCLQDVQFFTEVMDSVQTLDGGRRSMYDPDEIEEEQREREQRNKVRAGRGWFLLGGAACTPLTPMGHAYRLGRRSKQLLPGLGRPCPSGAVWHPQ